MSTPEPRTEAAEHPWREIDLEIYERHMGDARVGQLQRLHEITRHQLQAFPARTIAILGVAGGNGLDLIDPKAVDVVYGYDINRDYLDACAARYRAALGEKLRLLETTIDSALLIEPVELLIANLIIEYVGIGEFAAFAAANVGSIGALSCVVQRNETAGFVSCTEYASSFEGLAAVSSTIDAEALTVALEQAGFVARERCSYALPNGKTLIRCDFTSCGLIPDRLAQGS